MRWPPFEHIFFDCDSTLTTVEGIDILAEKVGKRRRVEILTQAAMDGAIDLEDIYKKRLTTLKPTRQQVLDLRHDYKRNMVEDAARVVAALQALGHKVYIISGGLAEPVAEFGISLVSPVSAFGRSNSPTMSYRASGGRNPTWITSAIYTTPRVR